MTVYNIPCLLSPVHPAIQDYQNPLRCCSPGNDRYRDHDECLLQEQRGWPSEMLSYYSPITTTDLSHITQIFSVLFDTCTFYFVYLMPKRSSHTFCPDPFHPQGRRQSQLLCDASFAGLAGDFRLSLKRRSVFSRLLLLSFSIHSVAAAHRHSSRASRFLTYICISVQQDKHR